MRSSCLALSLALVFAPAMAGAQDPGGAPPAEDPEPLEAARAAFEAGQTAYEAGRFEEAATQFERSFALSQEPDILFNLANAYDRLRRDREALESYRRYLELRPDTSDRAQIEARIEVLGRTVAAPEPEPAEATPVRTAEAAPSAEPAPLLATSDHGPTVGAWTLFGAGAAAVVAAVVMLAIAQADIDRVGGATYWPDVEESYQRAPVVSGAGIVTLGIGVAAAASGAVWLVVQGAL